MKHLRSFRLFEDRDSGLTPDQEKFLNRYTRGTWSVNRRTGLVDVKGGFYCSSRELKSLQGISFGRVSENFWCQHNDLTTLAGAPQTVGGDFSCHHNLLTSLEGAPQTVDGIFDCESNQLTTLEGGPQTVNGDFSCDAFELERGEWNHAGWLKILSTGNAEARKLILTLPFFQPDWWNSELQRDPGKTVHLLASCWKDLPKDLKSQIVIPSGYENEFGLFSEFDELGLF